MVLKTLQRLSAPGGEIVTLTEAKNYLRVEVGQDDALITFWIKAARALVEKETRRSILTQRWSLSLSNCSLDVGQVASGVAPVFFDGMLALPRAPLQAVESIRYYANGVLTTWDASNYVVVPGSPGKVRPVFGRSWPAADWRDDAIVVTFRAGFGDTVADVPEDLLEAARLGVFLCLGNWYENRSATVLGTISSELPFGFEAVLSPLQYGAYC